jgi:hypothetical protein
MIRTIEDYIDSPQEIKDDTVILVFGRFQPFTRGHLAMLQDVGRLVKASYKNYWIGTSYVDPKKHHSRVTDVMSRKIEREISKMDLDSDRKRSAEIMRLIKHKENPFVTDRKVELLKLGAEFAGLKESHVWNDFSGGIVDAIKEAKNLTNVNRLLLISGPDQAPKYQELLDKYKAFGFTADAYVYSKARETTRVSSEVLGEVIDSISATKVRYLAVRGRLSQFMDLVPDIFGDHNSRMKLQLYDDLRDAYYRMGVPVDNYIPKAKQGGAKKKRQNIKYWLVYNYIINKTKK